MIFCITYISIQKWFLKSINVNSKALLDQIINNGKSDSRHDKNIKLDGFRFRFVGVSFNSLSAILLYPSQGFVTELF